MRSLSQPRPRKARTRRPHADEALELPLAVVLRQHDRRPDCHQQILIAIVVRVGEQHALGVVEPGHPGLFTDVPNRSVRLLDEQEIGQAGAHRDVEVLETVAVEIADRDSLVAHEIRLTDRVDPPVPELAPAPEDLA